MSLLEVVNVVAIIISPIIAVLITQWLQFTLEKRKDKMNVFKTLMTARVYGWTVDSVNALNVIDVVFVNDNKVRKAWKDLYEKYSVVNPDEQHLRKIEQAQYKLLEEMAFSLGYKNKITWETIQNPYMPVGMKQQLDMQRQSQLAYTSLLTGMNQVLPKEATKTSAKEET